MYSRFSALFDLAYCFTLKSSWSKKS